MTRNSDSLVRLGRFIKSYFFSIFTVKWLGGHSIQKADTVWCEILNTLSRFFFCGKKFRHELYADLEKTAKPQNLNPECVWKALEFAALKLEEGRRRPTEQGQFFI